MALVDRELAGGEEPRAAQRSAARRQALPGWLTRPLLATLGLFLFVLALELLKNGAREYGREIMGLLSVTSPTNSLGFGWLLAYVFLSGSPVAAIAITLFAAGTTDALQTFTMITGSRLGASFVVLFVGFIYHLRGVQRSASVSIGVLALLTTAAIYLPALAVGYWLIASDALGGLAVGADAPLESFVDWLYGPILAAIGALGIPAWALMGAGIATLLAAFALLDRALPQVEAETSGFRRIGALVYSPLAMFVLGMAVTSVTLSVSVSLSILVPLSSRGLVRRENTLPYIMGANITTFIDTLVAALIIGGSAAFTIVLVEMLSVALLSVLVLLVGYRAFQRTILRMQNAIVRDVRTLVAFLALMLIVPLLLLLL